MMNDTDTIDEQFERMVFSQFVISEKFQILRKSRPQPLPDQKC